MKVAIDVDRPVVTAVYEVAGRFFIFKTSCVKTAYSIQQFLARWELTRHTGLNQQEPDTSILFELGTLPEIERSSQPFDLGDGVRAFSVDGGYVIRFPNALVSVDQSKVVRVRSPQPLGTSDPWLAQIVSHSLSAGLRRSGLFELHSAAVVDPDHGKALLICGPSGSGKSTLTLQLVASGWSYLSDDVVLLSADKEGIRATGLRRFFALTRHTIERSGLSQLNDLLSSKWSDSHPKRSLVPEDLFPSRAIHECYPDTIIFPCISERATSLTRELASTETMTRLIRLCPWSCYDSAVARRFLDLLARLARQSRSLELLAGSDLLGDSAFTNRFFNQVLETLGNEPVQIT